MRSQLKFYVSVGQTFLPSVGPECRVSLLLTSLALSSLLGLELHAGSLVCGAVSLGGFCLFGVNLVRTGFVTALMQLPLVASTARQVRVLASALPEADLADVVSVLPDADLDTFSSTDFEDLAVFAADVCEFLYQEYALLIATYGDGRVLAITAGAV
jgi:hypothetical protein